MKTFKTWRSKPGRLASTPGGQIVIAARQAWRDHYSAAQERNTPLDVAIEQSAVTCFSQTRGIQKGLRLNIEIIWTCILTGIEATGTVELKDFDAACDVLSERYGGFTHAAHY